MVEYLGFHDLSMILCGTAMGTIARLITLKVDTRQNPSYPTGYFLNVVMGIVASALGAVAIPSLLYKEFTAVTFITLAIQDFRDVRKSERESLQDLEETEYTKRGNAYIDGISKTYESRNYISLLTSFLVVLVLEVFNTENLVFNIFISLAVGFLTIYLLSSLTKGKTIGDICDMSVGEITFEHSDLLVDGMFVSSILGTQKSRDLFLREGVAIVVTPKKEKFRITIENPGQRQAMLFEATRTFGVKRFSFTRRNFKAGKLIIAFVPLIKDTQSIIRVIKKTPVLENSRKIHSIMDANIGGNFDGE
ncbi:MAG: YIEGIA domain-containing protein [Lacrimispora sp.]